MSSIQDKPSVSKEILIKVLMAVSISALFNLVFPYIPLLAQLHHYIMDIVSVIGFNLGMYVIGSHTMAMNTMGDGSNPQQGSSGQASSGQSSTGQASTNPVSNKLSDNLITPGPGDKVVLVKYGHSITDIFIANVQTKLFRGVSDFLSTNPMPTKGVSFYHAISTVNDNHPDEAFTSTDEEKIKILLVEKGIYNGSSPWNRLSLGNIIASTSARNNYKNITALGD